MYTFNFKNPENTARKGGFSDINGIFRLGCTRSTPEKSGLIFVINIVRCPEFLVNLLQLPKIEISINK